MKRSTVFLAGLLVACGTTGPAATDPAITPSAPPAAANLGMTVGEFQDRWNDGSTHWQMKGYTRR